MKVSIIIPVHNAADTIENCVESILLQNIDDLEIVLVENNSVDHSREVCKKLSEGDKRIIFIQTQKIGVSEARNIGLDHARGDIIGFCDADDYIPPNSLARVLAFFETDQTIDLVVGGFNIVSETQQTYRGFRKEFNCSFEKILNHLIYDERIMGSVCNKYFKRALLDGKRFNETLSYCEDMHFLANVLSDAPNNRVHVVNFAIYSYVSNLQSATHNFKELFGSDGDLKYITSFKEMMRLPKIKKHTRWILGRNIFYFSIIYYDMASNTIEKRVMLRNMRCYCKYYLRLMYIHPICVPKAILRLFVKKFLRTLKMYKAN